MYPDSLLFTPGWPAGESGGLQMGDWRWSSMSASCLMTGMLCSRGDGFFSCWCSMSVARWSGSWCSSEGTGEVAGVLAVDPAFLFMVAALNCCLRSANSDVTLVSVDPALVARLSGCLSPMSTVLPLPRIDPFKLESGLRMLARDRVWLVLISWDTGEPVSSLSSWSWAGVRSGKVAGVSGSAGDCSGTTR